MQTEMSENQDKQNKYTERTYMYCMYTYMKNYRHLFNFLPLKFSNYSTYNRLHIRRLSIKYHHYILSMFHCNIAELIINVGFPLIEL